MLKLKEENYNLRLDLKELTKAFYKLLGDKNMTKFNDEFISKVHEHWKENKGKVKYVAETGVHLKRTTSKKYGLQDLADHFNITEGQARRLLYVKRRN